MPDSSVSTRIASELLSVHESSIKRWCNAGELDFWTTPGGHRRIPISRLVSFASERGLEADIVSFGGSAERVWIGMESARREEDFGILSSLVLQWINLDRVDLVEDLVTFMTGHGFALGAIFDHVLGSAMRRIGSSYVLQEMSIGDEHRLTNLIRDALLGLRRLLGRYEDETVGHERGSAVVGCIRGETHEIGSLMVRLLLIRNGWRVVYLGQDVPTEEFHSQCIKHDARLLCISISPPRGQAEARDAINLLGNLFEDGKRVRIAIGGVSLGNLADLPLSDRFAEVQFFRSATPFEEWIASLTD
jgi:excisionase family DNA binding protein